MVKSQKSKYKKLTISIPPKLDAAIRRQAFNEKITLGELVEKYREAYFREKENEEKEKEKKAQKEQSTEREKDN